MRWIPTILLALALAPPAPAAPAELAFVGDGGILAMRADGSGRRVLVTGEVSDPRWSPDGTRLAYTKGPRIMVDGAAVTAPPRHAEDESPAWSPDGTTLLYARFISAADNDIHTEIRSRVLATGVDRRIVRERLDLRLTYVGNPAWSPDGSTIAYTRSRLDDDAYFRDDVLVRFAAGGAARTLVRDAHMAAFSPDGRRIAYASIRDHNGDRCGSDQCSWAAELYVAAADGSGPTRLTHGEGDELAPAWSPDGSRILFTSDQNVPDGTSNEVYSIAPDGSCMTWLTNGTVGSALGSWRAGSGDSFDPGSCDPNSRPLTVSTPPPAGPGLWLGTRYRNLLLTRQSGGSLFYDDCERFTAAECPDSLTVTSEPACRMSAFTGVTENPYRYALRRGALYLYAGEQAVVHVFSGRTLTFLQLDHGSDLPAVKRIIDDLRPIGTDAPAARLDKPRVPRALARRIDDTARRVARGGTVRAAQALHIKTFEVRRRLRLRHLLRPYAYC
jgi:hypothetical protein